ncbi:hypothetical protein M0P65_06125 [Candidatus Gracilibacteria bacterium]|jgi:hypothetical protein|nr:hypothetical protein [Candidatus Gracilibacteria bacterium]
MIIIDFQEQLTLFYNSCDKSDLFIIPIFLDDYNHPMVNEISSLYVCCLNTQDEFILPIDHHDKILSEISLKEIKSYFSTFQKNIFCIFKKNLLYLLENNKNLIDLNLSLYLITSKQINVTPLSDLVSQFYERSYGRLNKINFLIPITKHIEYCQKIKDSILKYVSNYESECFRYYNDVVISLLQQIETSGLFYDKELFKEFYPNKTNQLKYDYLYSQYNIFTATGRPSNKFGGINFAALNKKTGLRKIFISRFKDEGKLVEFDFDAYHLQLIANEIKYKFPTDVNPHTYLGRQFFGKDNISEEEYQQSKEISFRLLYGGIDKDFEKIDFFGLVNQYINKFWGELNNNGEFISPIFKRKLLKNTIDGFNKYTAWNYFIQLLETENSIIVIYQILKALKDKKSKLILYTYDGFLFDVYNEEWDKLKMELQIIFNNRGFHAKVKEGKNYNELKTV